LESIPDETILIEPILRMYKKWLDDGLIDEKEYKELKNKLLGIP